MSETSHEGPAGRDEVPEVRAIRPEGDWPRRFLPGVRLYPLSRRERQVQTVQDSHGRGETDQAPLTPSGAGCSESQQLFNPPPKRQQLAVRASPISKTAAILITIIGLFVLLTGVIAGVVTNEVEGAAFIILGLVLYGFLRRFTRKLGRELRSNPTSSQAAGRE